MSSRRARESDRPCWSQLASEKLSAAAQQAQAASAQAQSAEERAKALERELADLKGKKTDRGVVVTLGDVLFDTGLATLKPGAYSTIDRLATVLEGRREPQGNDRRSHRQRRQR